MGLRSSGRDGSAPIRGAAARLVPSGSRSCLRDRMPGELQRGRRAQRRLVAPVPAFAGSCAPTDGVDRANLPACCCSRAQSCTVMLGTGFRSSARRSVMPSRDRHGAGSRSQLIAVRAARRRPGVERIRTAVSSDEASAETVADRLFWTFGSRRSPGHDPGTGRRVGGAAGEKELGMNGPVPAPVSGAVRVARPAASGARVRFYERR